VAIYDGEGYVYSNDVTHLGRVGRVPWTFPVNRWPAVPRLVPALLPERRLTSARTHQSAPALRGDQALG